MSSFQIGLQDALHPVGLTTLLVLFVVLRKYARSITPHILIGLAFFAATAYFRPMIIQGGLDSILTTKGVSLGIRLFYLVLGGLFFVKGFKLWKVWWKMRFKGEAYTPQAAPPTKAKPLTHAAQCIFGGLLLGSFLAITSSVATQDYTVFVMLMDAHAQGNLLETKQLIPNYVLGNVIVIFAAWFLFGFRFTKNVTSWAQKTRPTLLIMASAFFMGTAFGLVWQFIK